METAVCACHPVVDSRPIAHVVEVCRISSRLAPSRLRTWVRATSSLVERMTTSNHLISKPSSPRGPSAAHPSVPTGGDQPTSVSQLCAWL